MAAFSHPRSVAGRALWRCLTQQYQCIALCKKVLKGYEPGEDAASDPCENRGENNMRAGTLSKNLT